MLIRESGRLRLEQRNLLSLLVKLLLQSFNLVIFDLKINLQTLKLVLPLARVTLALLVLDIFLQELAFISQFSYELILPVGFHFECLKLFLDCYKFLLGFLFSCFQVVVGVFQVSDAALVPLVFFQQFLEFNIIISQAFELVQYVFCFFSCGVLLRLHLRNQVSFAVEFVFQVLVRLLELLQSFLDMLDFLGRQVGAFDLVEVLL